MKLNLNENFEDWCKRVAMFEKGKALQDIATGKDIEIVLEEMSRRIIDKLLHPIFKVINESTAGTYDAEESKRQYKENYLDKNPKGVADHVESNS